jgi:hypothetical protein
MEPVGVLPWIQPTIRALKEGTDAMEADPELAVRVAAKKLNTNSELARRALQDTQSLEPGSRAFCLFQEKAASRSGMIANFCPAATGSPHWSSCRVRVVNNARTSAYRRPRDQRIGSYRSSVAQGRQTMTHGHRVLRRPSCAAGDSMSQTTAVGAPSRTWFGVDQKSHSLHDRFVLRARQLIVHGTSAWPLSAAAP